MTSDVRVLILTHTDLEGPGRIKDALDDLFMPCGEDRILDERHPVLPKPKQLLGLVIMGGPMGALDWSDHPGLKAEAKLVRQCVEESIPVTGVCLGHQIIATALGAKLHPGATSEIGWGRIRRVGSASSVRWPGEEGDETTVLHWHGDTVDVPKGGRLLASSKKTANQAFVLGPALGLQFHAEVGYNELDAWLADKTMTKGLTKKDIAKIREKYGQKNPEAAALARSLFGAFAVKAADRAHHLQGK